MEQRILIPVRNRGPSDLVVVVEPWASEINLLPGEDGEVVLIGHSALPNHSVEWCAYGLIITAEGGTDDIELSKGGERWG